MRAPRRSRKSAIHLPYILLACLILTSITFLNISNASIERTNSITVKRSHGLRIHGALKYPPNFKYFDYVNPNPPKGGTLTRNGRKFNNFNPFTIKGDKPYGYWYKDARIMAYSYDEIGASYCLVCEWVEVPSDRTWVRFRIREIAKFSDGKPITAADIKFTYEKLIKAFPFWDGYLKDIKQVIIENPKQILFKFKHGNNTELPMIIGGLPVYSKSYWEKKDLEKTTLEIPPSSGPLQIGKFEQGAFLEYVRVKDFWGKDLPVRRGFYNFDVLRYEIYQDKQVELEALKKGLVDVFYEIDTDRWHRAYNFKEIQDGMVEKKIIPWGYPPGKSGLVFNMRRKVFQDLRVRRALFLLFEAEWKNKAFRYGEFTRVRSFFEHKGLEAVGLPKGEELAILNKYRGQIPEGVFTEEFKLPKNDTAEARKENAKEALRLFALAGFKYDKKTNRLLHEKTGKQLEFEILIGSNRHEKDILPYSKKLKRFGVNANVRMVEGVAYERRQQIYDYDMTYAGFWVPLSPGNEQRSAWTTEHADKEESDNYAGIRSKAVDEIVERLIVAKTRESLEAHTRALDRVLNSMYIVIPFWDFPADRMVHWKHIKMPDKMTLSGKPSMLWWMDSGEHKEVQKYKESR